MAKRKQPPSSESSYETPMIPGVDQSVILGLPKRAAIKDSYTWIYENLGLEEPDMESCPSRGAYAQYLWAKADPDSFYTKYNQVMGKEADEGRSQEGNRRFTSAVEAHIHSLLDVVGADGHSIPSEEFEILPGVYEAGDQSEDQL